MTDPKYKAFTALDPFFDIVQQGLAGQVDGEHYFDTIAENAVFEFRYIFPGWPQKVASREALMAVFFRLRQKHLPARRGRAHRPSIPGRSCSDPRIRGAR
jgi:hypothetical protein